MGNENDALQHNGTQERRERSGRALRADQAGFEDALFRRGGAEKRPERAPIRPRQRERGRKLSHELQNPSSLVTYVSSDHGMGINSINTLTYPTR